MSATIEDNENHSISQPDTSRETYIGWKVEGDGNKWTSEDANSYWGADHLYLRKGRDYKHKDQTDGGFKNGPTWWNQSYFTHLCNRDMIDILSRNLELNQHQRSQAISYFMGLDLQKWGIQKELVAWSTCSYFVHQDDSNQRRCHPESKDIDELFLQAAHSLNLPFKDRVKTWGKVERDYRVNW